MGLLGFFKRLNSTSEKKILEERNGDNLNLPIAMKHNIEIATERLEAMGLKVTYGKYVYELPFFN